VAHRAFRQAARYGIEFKKFLALIAGSVPKELDVHLIIDNPRLP
jgi:hypothetical protein